MDEEFDESLKDHLEAVNKDLATARERLTHYETQLGMQNQGKLILQAFRGPNGFWTTAVKGITCAPRWHMNMTCSSAICMRNRAEHGFQNISFNISVTNLGMHSGADKQGYFMIGQAPQTKAARWISSWGKQNELDYEQHPSGKDSIPRHRTRLLHRRNARLRNVREA